ncbi:MAG: hypothetical protein AAFO79_05215, partial [Pseudomonadota bacterium]
MSGEFRSWWHRAGVCALLSAVASGGLLPAPPASAADRRAVSGCTAPSKRAVAVTVVGTAGPDILRLADGRSVRLVGALPPIPPARLDAHAAWPPQIAATRALQTAVGQAVYLSKPGKGRIKRGRYGNLRALAWAAFPKPSTTAKDLPRELSPSQLPLRLLQEEQVSAGHARVFPHKLTPPCAATLLRAEAAARAARAGLWA